MDPPPRERVRVGREARVDRDYLWRTAARLVAIESVNPTLVAGGAGEGEIAAWVAEAAAGLGLEVHLLDHGAGRASVVARLPGSGGGRSLMLNAHFDTVGVEGMENPFSGEIRDGRLFGRGSYDMKGSLAACLGAVRTLQEVRSLLRGDVLIAAVADEEHASIGTAEVARQFLTDGAIVTEPTSLDLCTAHKGFVWIEVETRGRAAHGSRPDLGIDANTAMGHVLHALDALQRDIAERRRHPLLGPASMHAATLHGGTGLSTYADRCVLGIERRTLPGESTDEVVAEITGLLDSIRAERPEFQAELRVLLDRPPFEARPDSALFEATGAAVQHVLGRSAQVRGEMAWMDSALLVEAGADVLVIGPHGEGAHAREEWVDLESVAQLAEILVETAELYCS